MIQDLLTPPPSWAEILRDILRDVWDAIRGMTPPRDLSDREADALANRKDRA